MRSAILAACLLSFGLLFGHAPPPAAAEQGGVGPQGQLSLQETLERALRARRPQEFAYIAMVVEKVDDGTLPRDLVESTFQWARKKQTRHQVVYFAHALRIRAAKLGIELEPIE
jgi:hypothetical protein